MGCQEQNNTVTKSQTEQEEAAESLAKYNAEIIALRSKELVGKVVQGTLIHDGKRFWVRWNKRKCDTVFVKPSLLKSVLGDEPKVGTQIKCTIHGLGPDLSKLVCQTAWFMHPQTNAIEVAVEEPRKRKPVRLIRRSPETSYDRSRFFGTKKTTGNVNWGVRTC